jgi:hypothetical protein
LAGTEFVSEIDGQDELAVCQTCYRRNIGINSLLPWSKTRSNHDETVGAREAANSGLPRHEGAYDVNDGYGDVRHLQSRRDPQQRCDLLSRDGKSGVDIVSSDNNV